MLVELLKQLDSACKDQDWQLTANLDKQLRATFERQIKSCNKDASKTQEVLARLQTAMAQYEEIIEACEKEKQQLVNQQHSLIKGQKISHQYLNFG